MSTYYFDPNAQPPQTTGREHERRSGWHSVNVGHLVMGLAFLGLVAVWGAVQIDAVPDDNVRWLLPLPWVFAGAAGLIAATVASGLRWRRANQEPAPARAALPYEDPYADPPPLIPDHTGDLDEKLARYDLRASPAAEETKEEDDR